MESNELSTLDGILKYRSSNPGANLIIDTNILVLILVGNYDKNYIEECPLMKENGKNYTPQHFELLNKIFSRFPNKVFVNPHVISEVNMLAKKLGGRQEEYLESIVKQLEYYQENHTELKFLLGNKDVIKFGFTDISLIEYAVKGNIILTDEFPLYGNYKEELPIIYFTNVFSCEAYNLLG